MTWTDAQGVAHEISKMATPYLENCITLIDELLPRIIKRRDDGIHASNELTLKRDQKKEMLRVLASRRVQNQRVSPVTPYSCHSCMSSDEALNELICRKNNIFCRNVNFTCGAWNGKK